MNRVYFLFAVWCVMSLTACMSLRNIDHTMQWGEASAAQAHELAQTLHVQPAQRDTVVFSDVPIVALKPLRKPKPEYRSESLNCTLTFAPVAPMDILEFGQMVTKLCGIPVRVTPDALAAVNDAFATSGARSSPGATSGTSPLPPLPPIPALSGALNRTGQASVFSASPGLISNIKWNHQAVEGLLDVVTARLGLSWRVVEGVVSIFYLDTRTFHFYAIPSATDLQSVVQSGTTTAAGVSGGTGGGLSGNAGSSQTTAISLKTSISDDLAKTVQSMLTPKVGRMAMSAAMGALTVTDTPEVLSRVERYLQSENHLMTQQVLLNVKVISVTLTDQDRLGIDWNLVYKTLSGRFGIHLKNAFQAESGGVSGSVGILDTATGAAVPFSGSSLIIQALSRQGRVSTITSPSVTTLNLQPVPVQIARQTSYLASVQTTNTAQVGSTTSLTPGTVTTGFNMNLLPYVMPDHHLLLQYSINLSALQRLRSVKSGNSLIEIPEVDNRIFSQKVRLKSGETLVLSGFEQSIDHGTKSGVGHPDNILLGGALDADNRRDVIVVLITPIVME